MSDLARDVGFAVRQFRRQPGWPLVIVFSLACGMGISTSMFSVVAAIWFTPWAVRDAASVRVIAPAVSLDAWHVLREHARAFNALGVAAQGGQALAHVCGQVVRVEFVSANYFHVLQIPMFIGPGLPAESSGAADTAVISHRLWEACLGSPQRIVGQQILLQPAARSRTSLSITVGGIAAAGFDGPDLLRTQLWLPLAAWSRFQPSGPGQDAEQPSTLRVTMFGHLMPGTSDRQAESELFALLRPLYPGDTLSSSSVAVRGTARFSLGAPPLQTQVMWGMLLLGTVFITLIACANVTNLVLARGHARRVEIAVRLALGAGRPHLMRQLLTESALLCLMASVLGLALASRLPDVIYDAFLQNTSPDVANRFQLSFPIDWRAFSWSLLMAVVACVAFGVLPAWRCTDVRSSEVLKDGQGLSTGALMPSLLSYQAIVAVMALVIAGLMLRSDSVREALLLKQSVADLAAVLVEGTETVAADQREILLARTSEQLAILSGGAGVAGMAGQMTGGARQTLRVTPNYFDVVQIPWLSGRTFHASDPRDRVMVVNDAFARRFWPDRSAIGQVLTSDEGVERTLVGRQVIGVVANRPLLQPTAYLLADTRDLQVLIVRAPTRRIERDIGPFIAGLQPSVRARVLSGQAWIGAAVGPSLVIAGMTITFGGAAVMLSAVGLFSFLQFSVRQRLGEISIRRALGAQSWHVAHAVVAPAARPLARGLLLGAAGAACIGEFMRQADLPGGLNPFDPVTYAVVALVMAGALGLASYGPVRRALETPPNALLRSQ